MKNHNPRSAGAAPSAPAAFSVDANARDEKTTMHNAIPSLYTCYSIESEWPHRGMLYEDVRVTWFVNKRPDATAFAERYSDACNLADPYSRGVIAESFTAEEALAFARYLRDWHQSDVCIDKLPMPVEKHVMSVGAIAVGGTSDFCMLDRDDCYPLSFPVWGYYDVGRAKCKGPIAGTEHTKPVSIVLKRNNCAVRTRCAFCDMVDRADTPFAAMVEGTEDWVCYRCLEKYTCAGAWRALNIFNGAMVMALQGRELEALYDYVTDLTCSVHATVPKPPAEKCTRCDADESLTHHRLCQDRDGTPSGLPDDLVREALAIKEDDAIRYIAPFAFLDGLTSDSLMDLNAEGLALFRERHGIPPAIMNRAWQALQDRGAADNIPF